MVHVFVLEHLKTGLRIKKSWSLIQTLGEEIWVIGRA